MAPKESSDLLFSPLMTHSTHAIRLHALAETAVVCEEEGP